MKEKSLFYPTNLGWDFQKCPIDLSEKQATCSHLLTAWPACWHLVKRSAICTRPSSSFIPTPFRSWAFSPRFLPAVRTAKMAGVGNWAQRGAASEAPLAAIQPVARNKCHAKLIHRFQPSAISEMRQPPPRGSPIVVAARRAPNDKRHGFNETSSKLWRRPFLTDTDAMAPHRTPPPKRTGCTTGTRGGWGHQLKLFCW